jgi:two-component system, chemotaxis family, chemotaxis protein CheY
MPKRVLSVGQCGPDHAAIRTLLTHHFDCEVVQAHSPDDTLRQLSGDEFHLVLINRKLDRDYSDGIEIIRAMKANPATADVPVMLVTNFPEHQEAAVAAGALAGFGKLHFEHPATHGKLAAVLGK